jgi:hypothetical protein
MFTVLVFGMTTQAEVDLEPEIIVWYKDGEQEVVPAARREMESVPDEYIEYLKRVYVHFMIRKQDRMSVHGPNNVLHERVMEESEPMRKSIRWALLKLGY